MAWTPTEQRIINLLSDGTWHTNEELRHCVDEHASIENLRIHIHRIRRVLEAQGKGEDIVARDGGYYMTRRVSQRE